jgi:aspartate carbamoyltransferase catalytic subunit
MGDLKNGRTVHSLINILRKLYNVNINLVSPDNLQLPYYLDNAIPKSTSLTENICKTTDVLYMTRVQKERGSVGEYTLTKDHVNLFKKNMIVMHPFPRQNEIPTWFDTDRRAYYFKQIQNGLYVRMAILSEIINAK